MFYIPSFIDVSAVVTVFVCAEIVSNWFPSHVLLQHLDNNYDMAFECMPCAPGCDTCTDPSPCVLTLNWLQRSILLGVSGLIMCFILVLLWFTIQYREVKVSHILLHITAMWLSLQEVSRFSLILCIQEAILENLKNRWLEWISFYLKV